MAEDGEKDVEIATAKVTIEVNVDKGEEQEITNTHTFFANMGGFDLRICALSLSQQDRTQGNGPCRMMSPRLKLRLRLLTRQ